MWNYVKTSLICLCFGIVFSGSAGAVPQRIPAPQKVAIYVFDSQSKSFSDFLSPGVGLGQDVSSLFQKKKNVTWTINSFFLLLPYVSQGVTSLLALSGDATTGWNYHPLETIGWASSGYYQPPILLVFYQEQINVNAVPEASAGVMMALGLPLLGWLVWRRQRQA